jgi:endonuclease/exonuclease/phosphatase family metal-dependent hydrolase
MLNLAFFNTWEGNAEKYRKWLEDGYTAYDVIGLSEVNSHPKSTPNDHVSFPNQFEKLQSRYKKTHRGCFATSASSAQGIDYGLALLHRYDCPVYNIQSEVIHGQAGAYWVRPRMITSCNQIQSAWVDLGQEWLLFAHTHCMWRKSGKHDCVERDAQSARIVNHLERRMYEVNTQGKPIHVVLGGDFNMIRRLRALEAIRRHTLFGKSGAVVLNDYVEDGLNTRTKLYEIEKETRQADFVLVSESLRERVALHIDRDVPSDHALLSVQLET